jgi:hypothetical protein
MDDQTEALLLSTPPRLIGLKLLSEYTWSANGSNDQKFSADELRHFLPRYFHFITYGLVPNFSGDWQPTLRQLGLLKYRDTWPAIEIETVDAFFAALLSRELEKPLSWTTRADGSPIAYSNVDDLLSSMAYAGGSMELLLKEWEQHTGEFATHHAACLIDDCERSLELGSMRFELPGPYWDDYREQAATVRQWLFRSETTSMIAAAIRPDTNIDLRQVLVRANEAAITALGIRPQSEKP